MEDAATPTRADATAPSRRSAGFARFREALAARDWTGVAIELAVVIIGILIAFQISEWGERRAASREERRYLERLVFETRRGIAELEQTNAFHDRVTHDIAAAFAARNDPGRLQTYSRTLDFGCGAARFQAAPFNDTAFEEVLTTGRLNLISDEGLRNDVRDLASAQAAAARQVQSSRELMMGQLPALNPHYRFEMSPVGRSQCFIDWQALMADRGAVNAAIRAYRTHQFSRAERAKVIEQSQRVLRELQCKLGKPECHR